MIDVRKHIGLLGLLGRDKVTRSEGTITTVSFDLYGCVQVILTPTVDKDGKRPESGWFDSNRIEVLNDSPVMELPDFDLPKSERMTSGAPTGPADKPPVSRMK